MEVTTQVSTAPAFASMDQALEILESAMGYLAAADPTQVPTGTQARCLQTLERVDAAGTAARASFLGGFTTSRGYCEDADYSPRTWLMHHTRITRGAAGDHTGWARRAAAHPVIRQALAAMDISRSFARVICWWTDKLPGESRNQADEILAAAAVSGLDLPDVVALAAEMYERSRPADEDDPDRPFRDRSVRLETTFQGAGVLSGDLSPECAALVNTVLDALSAPAGAEDTRTHGQRYHDALAEAMRRLLAADLLPERAGQPVKALARISLADLIVLDAGSMLLNEWIAGVRARWAAARAAASVNGGGDGGAWLDGGAAAAFTCDASITPVVFGDVNHDALEGLVQLCVELGGHGPGRCGPGGTGPQPPAERGREALELAIIGKAVDLLSGPGGLASFLRRRELGARLGGASLPLDIGMSEDIPAGIRNAVKLRDLHCQWAGGCSQPASMCEVHHLVHLSRGGKTSVKNCILLCHYHHQVVIHRLGWTLVLNPDGTTTAWNPDRTKVIRSHSPPARAG
jgi:Domain of unknown function (DUF222)/HNH endonuclease